MHGYKWTVIRSTMEVWMLTRSVDGYKSTRDSRSQ